MWSSAGQLLADELSALLPETNITVLHHEAFGLYGEPTYGFDRITVKMEVEIRHSVGISNPAYMRSSA